MPLDTRASESKSIIESNLVNKSALESCLSAIDQSLRLQHPALSTSANPVLIDMLNNFWNADRIAKVLLQYCFLPAEIVDILNTARNRFANSSVIYSELTRNINEELGSRTNGSSHYEILRQVLLAELSIEISGSPQAMCTEEFLLALKKFLSGSANDYVIGAIYGIESAAVPELTIVATLINHYATIIGKVKPVIKMPMQRACFIDVSFGYNLNKFFAMHLLDFEVGHKNGLARAIEKYHFQNRLNLRQFNDGFEFVLQQMDNWWNKLAVL